jgi:hypothetical protein
MHTNFISLSNNLGKGTCAERRATVPVAAALCLLFALVTPLTIRAQVAGGSITGTVTGEAGGAMPDVRVSIKDVSSGVARTATTNTSGLYSVPNLSPGSYEMTVSAPGFTTQLWTDITVAAGVERILNVVMRAGNPDQVVRVAAPPALVSEPCPAVCGSASASTVRDTPLNGRDWAALATLQAGVTGVQNGSATGGGNLDRGFGAAVSISGSRPDQNSYRLDGISINDYANGAPGSVLGDNLGIDAVEQVSVLGSNYPAEYGRTSGGVINVATRAGKNAFHGSVYEFLRNSALDARNFFDPAVIPPFIRNQFGGSGGLPIKKDRTFIFGDYEGLRQSLGVTTVDTVPSDLARTGTLNFTDSKQFPSNCTALSATQCQVMVDPSVARFLKAFYPSATDPVPPGSNTGVFRFAAQEITTENYFTIRFDHKFSESDSVYATYMRDSSKTVQPGIFGELYSDIVSSRQVATLHEQHIFNPNFLNVAQVGFNRAVGINGKVDHVVSAYASAMADPSYQFVPNGFAGDIQSVPGVTSFLGAPTAEGYIPSSRALYWTSVQGGDDAVLTRGRHALKFGAGVERMLDNEVSASNVNGLFRFDSLAQLLTNQPSLFSGTADPLPFDIGIRETLFGAYVQDDIRMQRTLTLNAGFRYEMLTVPSESHGKTSVLRNLTDSLPVCGTASPGCVGTGPLFSNPTLRNFEPRLGFAWNPHGGKTLVRGGFGIFDVLPLPYEFTLTFQRTAPFTRTIVGENPPPGSFSPDPTGKGTIAYNLFAKQSNTNIAYYDEANPKRNYVMQWNLSVARELTSTLAVTVGYVGSRGIHQPYRVDNIDMVGQPLVKLTSAGYLWPIPNTSHGVPGTPPTCTDGSTPTKTGCPWPKLNPNFGRINATLWQANSSYDALQVDVAKRVSHGIQFHGAYTWGKSMDTLSATEADDAFPNGLFNQIFFDQRTTRGLSDFNVAQDLVLSATWEIPGPRQGSKLPQWAFGGWQVVGLYKASTGQPFTPILGGDPAGTRLDETGLVPNYTPACKLVDPNFKKNSNGPIYLNLSCFSPPTVPTSSLGSLPYGCAGYSGATPLPPGSTLTYCANLRGNLGRNVVIGPGLSKLDLSVFKNNYIKRISESFNAQFRAEIFNIFNRANFGSPTDNLAIFDQNGVLQTQTAGLLTSTQTTSRQIQFALKLIW